jgi:hypothetical protein
MQIKFKHGMNEVNTEIEEGTTIQDIIDSDVVSEALRLPESVTTLVNGTTMANTYTLRDGDVVTFERAAAAKAMKKGSKSKGGGKKGC